MVVVDEDELSSDKQTGEENAVEECLANRDQLPTATVGYLLRQRFRLSQLIRLINRRQQMFCRPASQQGDAEYRYAYRLY